MEFKNYEEFWLFYLTQHRKPVTRAWHFAGTSLVFVFILLSFITWNFWILILAPVSAYSLAWISHFFIEGNKPATFGHPFWSLRADFRMYCLTLSGRLNNELKRVAS
ncbi:DUF962 domain-containing protein [Peribacillus kribbensis]|uniref:DUF962 domain-containing protein n=1 Tax=Peribacillus kribbensis TaxID=356658 RepID=UPI00040FA612|nr:DUF962 domain-containing protein [Peribacillus kribbensis]